MEERRQNQPLVVWLIFMVLSVLIQEIVLAFFTKGFSLWYLSFALIIPSLVLALLVVLDKKYRKWLIDIYMLGTALIFAGQLLYFKAFGDFYGFGTGALWGQFFSQLPKLFLFNLPFLLVFFLPWAFFFYFLREGLEGLNLPEGLYIIPLALALIVFLSSFISLVILPKKPGSAAENFFSQTSQLDKARKFGLIGAMNIELVQKILPSGAGSSRASRGQAQVLDLDFEALAEGRDQEHIREMDLHFAQQEPSMKNKYTGIFKGYNMIYINAESLWWPAVNADLTPTLYKMMSQGIHLEDFYNPLWALASSDGEYMGLSGMLPKEGIWSLLKASQNYSPQLAGWRFKEAGYLTYAYNGHDYDYYDRHISHPKMGYDYKGLGSGLSLKDQQPSSDLELMEKTIDEYIDEELFQVYYLTNSAHPPYKFSDNAMAAKNKQQVEDLGLGEEAASYLAASLELEQALSYLLEKLEEKGLDKKTLIAINPDHYPYELGKKAQEELVGEVTSDRGLFSSVGIIYAPGMKTIKVDKPVSSLDMMPTIYNLLGIDYESRLLIGQDIFGKEEGLVRFLDGSWISDQGYYDFKTGDFTAYGEVSSDYVEEINKRIEADFYYSSKILEEDYYSLLPRAAFETD